jgi:uncharacterized membrane protein YeiH
VLLLVLDLVGVFVFALDGAVTAQRAARLDVVGVVTVGLVTAIGGGVLRDVLIGAVPPATVADWRYPAVATAGALIAFAVGGRLSRLAPLITVLDAAGLGLYAVTGASTALDHGLGAGQAIVLGTITAVGGGTMRDLLVRRVPAVLHSGFHAVPAVIASGVTVGAVLGGVWGPPAAVAAVAACFLVRVLGRHASRKSSSTALNAGGFSRNGKCELATSTGKTCSAASGICSAM